MYHYQSEVKKLKREKRAEIIGNTIAFMMWLVMVYFIVDMVLPK